MMVQSLFVRLSLCVVCVSVTVLTACATRPENAKAPPPGSATNFPVANNSLSAAQKPSETVVSLETQSAQPIGAARVQAATGFKPQDDDKSKLYIGSGQLLRPVPPRPPGAAGDVRYNFENTDIREVVRGILSDTLQENYVIDPAVTGAVTIRMTKGVPRADLIPILEVMLRQVNAILVRDGALWRVQPAAAGVRGVGRPNYASRAAGTGYGITFVPLQHIGVNEMMRLLDAIVKEPLGQGGAGGSVRPEPLRNMLIVAGTPAETQYILETVQMFDVDWMAGMSAGLFTLEHSEAKKVLEEVDKVLGGLGAGAPAPAGAAGLGPLFGLVRIQLIERLNAILVLSPRPDLISQAETWIRRLDRGGSGDSTRFYVYNLQYTSAEKIGPVLQQAMQGRASTPTPAAQTAPGQNPLSIATPVAVQSNPAQPIAVQPIPARVAAQPAVGAGQGSAVARNATIIADKDRNALLIVSTPAEYSAIEAAIKKLDVLPRQVMVEVTVLEVDLTDDFALGVEWAASRDKLAPSNSPPKESFGGSINKDGSLGLVFARADLVGSILNKLDATLNAKDSKKRARIHASPKLMAVDNTPVTFNVGRSVSVQTQAVTSVNNVTPNTTTSSFQYLQTGISVSITPRISAGGLVNLEITQEISEPTSSGVAGNPNPDISKTALKNTILAQDGETIVMAGLIREKITDNSNGLPGVSRIPFLGGLFGSQGVNVDKQEILVLVRPVVISTIEQARNASDEIRSKMNLLRDEFGSKSAVPLPRVILDSPVNAEISSPGAQNLKLSPSLTEGVTKK